MNGTRPLSVLLSLAAVLVVFLLVVWIGPSFNENLQLDETALLRFVFVGIGLLAVFVVYWLTRGSGAWEVGTREVVYMAIGAALYAVFSYLFNGTVFAVPSVSQVALRPAIAIPMFFGYAFGPVVGLLHRRCGQHVWRRTDRLWPLTSMECGQRVGRYDLGHDRTLRR